MKSSSFNTHQIWIAVWFLALTFVLYGHSLNHEYNIDDDYVIEKHELAQQGIKAIPDIFSTRYHTERDLQFGYRPLTIAVYAIEYQIFGENLNVFHLMNLLWYVALLFVLYKLFRLLLPQVSLWYIVIVITIFAVHPLHSEVVLSLKNREEILCLLLASLSWIQFIRFYEKSQWQRASLGVIFLGLAFLTKETAIIFIAIIPLSLFYFRTKKNWHQEKGGAEPEHSKKKHILVAVLQLLILTGMFFNPDLFKSPPESIISIFLEWFVFIIITIWWLKQKKEKPLINKKHPLVIVSFGMFAISLFTFIVIKEYSTYFLMLGLLLFGGYAHRKSIKSIFFQIKRLKIPKYIWTLFGITILLGIVLFAVYYIPKTSLPEQNAPVFNWQNPLFYNHTTTVKIGVVFYSLAWYIKLLFMPFPLRFYYGYALIPTATLNDPVVIISIILHILLIYLIFKGLKKKKIWSFAIAFYFIGIIPFSNLFFPLPGVIAERFLFIPSLGFSIAITWLIFHILKQRIDVQEPQDRSGIIALSILIILPFSIISMQRTPDWKNRKTLYEADIPKLKKSAKANNLYANFLASQIYDMMQAQVPLHKMDKKINKAIKHFQQAIAVDSTYANPYHNLGYIYLIIARDYQKAEDYFSKSIRYDSTIYEAFMNRGIARFYQNKLNQAEKDLIYSKKHGFRKDMDKVYHYLARVYESQNDTTKAIAMYDSVLNYNPGQIKSIEKIMHLYANQKKYEKALQYSNMLVNNASPKNDKVWVDKGNYHLLLGDTVQAIQAWEKAFNIYPGNYNIAMTLARYYTEHGMQQKAYAIRNKANSFRQQQGPKQGRQ
jgi:tetratricopeptide (TPR) repeat protein